MKVYFLHHSAVAVSLDKSLLIFDHYICDGKGTEKGSVGEEDIKNASAVYVFASHSHGDHFSKDIFKWAEINPNTVYLLDSTIRDLKLPEKSIPEKTAFLSRGDTYSDGYISVKEFGSTDIGGSFYVQCEGVSIFHAGDFNYWHWRDDGDKDYTRQMKLYFDRELRFMRADIESIDYAFFPVDSRMGSGYDEGADIFIKTMKPKVFIPIHAKDFGDTEKYAEKHFEGTRIIAVNKNGQRLV
jgi:L-ascorbate metabolism protein UlaG (beta-lactamase superfamily)